MKDTHFWYFYFMFNIANKQLGPLIKHMTYKCINTEDVNGMLPFLWENVMPPCKSLPGTLPLIRVIRIDVIAAEVGSDMFVTGSQDCSEIVRL